MSNIAASIVVFKNNKDTLKKTLDSCLKTGLLSHLYVIDNSPTDDLRNICYGKNIKYVFNNANLGFGASHNIAIRKSLGRSKYHLILNPDIWFDEGTLEKLFSFMEKHPDVGLVMPKICYPDGSIQHLCKLLPAPIDLIIRRLNLPLLKKAFKNRINQYEFGFTDYNKIMDVPHLSGCFMFIRTKLFEDIGLFDERFFMYLEDVDLSRRIARKYRTVYFPEVKVFHGYEKGSYKNLKLLKYHIISFVKYFNKWGWVFDNDRNKINQQALAKIKSAQ